MVNDVISFLYIYHQVNADNLQLSLDKISNQNPFLTVVLGDFNTKSLNWYKHDKTTYEGSKIDTVTLQFGVQQLRNRLTSWEIILRT